MEEDLERKIRVVVRFRPLLAREENIGSSRLDPSMEEVTDRKTGKTFKFDRVFPGPVSQADLYEEAKLADMAESLLQGLNATVIAYGQTGSGKTHTMEGFKYDSDAKVKFETTREEDIGVVPRIVRDLFLKLQRGASSRTVTLACSFYQIYNERAYDLLNGPLAKSTGEGSVGLRVRWDTERGFYLENLFETACVSFGEVMAQYRHGVRNKVMGGHAMNEASSRAHTVFTLKVTSVDPQQPSHTWTSRLTLVDLAGSERQAQTRNSGDSLRESIHINKSLAVLRRVITVLSGDTLKRVQAPFRDSKLTSLLKEPLQGNSITLMIACVSPSDDCYEETLSTLCYASLAQAIAVNPTVNEAPHLRTIRELRKEVTLLKRQLKEAQEFTSRIGRMEMEGKEQLKRGQEAEAERLREDLLDNIALVKRMFTVEQALRARLEDEEVRGEERERESQTLQAENADLRERVDLLSSLLEGKCKPDDGPRLPAITPPPSTSKATRKGRSLPSPHNSHWMYSALQPFPANHKAKEPQCLSVAALRELLSTSSPAQGRMSYDAFKRLTPTLRGRPR